MYLADHVFNFGYMGSYCPFQYIFTDSNGHLAEHTFISILLIFLFESGTHLILRSTTL